MATSVGEFVLNLAVDATSGNLSVNKLVSSLGELDVASVGTVGIIAKVSESLWSMAKAATQTAVELTALNAITGADPKIVQQWEYAAEQVTGHTGTIIKAIQAVNDMNIKRTREGVVPNAIGFFGSSMYKFDEKGNPVYKTLMDYIKEFSSPTSLYQMRSRESQVGGLRGLFGGAGDDVYMIIEAMKKGQFHPEDRSVLSDRQVRDLKTVDSDWIRVKQDVVGLFDRFLIAGHMVDEILKGLDSLLTRISGLIGHPNATEDFNRIGATIEHALEGKGSKVWQDIREGHGLLSAEFQGKMASFFASKIEKNEGALAVEINFKQNGAPVGKRKNYVERGVKNQDIWEVTDQANLAGPVP